MHKNIRMDSEPKPSFFLFTWGDASVIGRVGTDPAIPGQVGLSSNCPTLSSSQTKGPASSEPLCVSLGAAHSAVATSTGSPSLTNSTFCPLIHYNLFMTMKICAY